MNVGKPRSLSAATGEVLGTSVDIAVPLQRRDPRLVLLLCAVEIAALVWALVTLSGLAFGATAIAGIALVVLRTADQRRIVAVTSGGIVILVATTTGKPVGVIGSAPADLSFPAPSGLGIRVRLGDHTWWVDRAEFPRVRRARELLDDPGAQRRRPRPA